MIISKATKIVGPSIGSTTSVDEILIKLSHVMVLKVNNYNSTASLWEASPQVSDPKGERFYLIILFLGSSP